LHALLRVFCQSQVLFLLFLFLKILNCCTIAQLS